ncbi:hypothetical protein [uncultured Roseovarius sp.]|uniref:hypothetical protein n=1 Tax=uncultured Roseovarius sp. TaxID=293344 RepID=UPI0030DCDD72
MIGALRVNLGLDSAQFEKGAKRAQSSTQKLAAQVKKIAAIGAAAFTALNAAALAGARDIDAAAKASRRLGASIGGFEAIKLAAEEAGVPVSALTDNLQNIDREIAKGGKNTTEALDRLGLTAEGISTLEADEKIALIADRVKDLGLSSGEATALLQALGVRSREMVLLLQGGGDAIRQARKDVEDYGLALSGPVAASIEQANDRIGRLSLVARVFGQQMAIAVVPALGALALAVTDSLREGGALRAVIDGIVSATRGWVTVISGAVSGLSSLADFIGGPAIAAVSALAAAFVILQRRMILTGIGALIVGVGALIDFMMRLRDSTGSWGEALSAVFDLGKSVFLGIGNTAWGLSEILAGVAAAITGSFVRAFAEIAKAWDALVNGMGDAWNALAGSAFGETLGLGVMGRSNTSGILGGLADGLFDGAVDSINRGGQRIRDAGQGVSDAIGGLRDIINSESDATTEAADSARTLADTLDDVGGSGGSAAKAAKGLTDMTKAAREAAQAAADSAKQLAAGITDPLKDAFKSGKVNAEAFSGAMQGVFGNLRDRLIDNAFKPIEDALFNLFSGASGGGGGGLFGGIGSALGGLFAGFFDTGGRIGAGQFGIVGERGPEIVSGPANVTSRVDTARMMQGGGGGRIEVVARVENGSIVQDVRRISGEVAVQVTQAGIKQFAREGLSVAVDRINKDPRRRG